MPKCPESLYAKYAVLSSPKLREACAEMDHRLAALEAVVKPPPVAPPKPKHKHAPEPTAKA